MAANLAASALMAASCPPPAATLPRHVAHHRTAATSAIIRGLGQPLKPLRRRNTISIAPAVTSSPTTNKIKNKLTRTVAMASSNDTEPGTAEIAVSGSGLIAVPVVAWSLYTLKTTGCGLPPGPGGALGALEGVSYLVVLGVVGWSVYTKVKTGSGLPNGPFGLLGAVEGMSYLVILASLVVLGFQLADFGYIPSATPDERCFG